ncbi:Nucleoporin nup85 [Mycoemilia scoparia]|uniref:Nuclear pore complex protein Nup85 n=1 Tax=Mycoemilia scoparia TaxID=417184 RepID=A0A9W8A3W2_9FUNG|nr:Nucleoporin nup85 [Mycoemilia scoparia]
MEVKTEVEMKDHAVINLNPGLFAVGRSAEWSERNRTLLTDIHPFKSELVACVGGKKAKEELSHPETVFEQDLNVYFIKWNNIPDNQLAKSQELMEVQEDGEEALVERVGMEHLLKLSTYYRDSIMRHLSILQGEVLDDCDTENGQANEEAQAFQYIHALWQLCEIFYFYLTSPQDQVQDHYIDWLNKNFPSPSTMEGQSIISDSDPVNHEDSPLDASESAEEIKNLVVGMPLRHEETSISAYNTKWRDWHNRCRMIYRAMEGGEENDEAWSHLHKLVSLLQGDEESIMESSQSWQEAVCAMLLYSQPTITVANFPDLVETCFGSFGVEESSAFDHATVSLINGNLGKFIILCNQIDWWFVAHITNLLYHMGLLEELDSMFPVDMHEYFITSYAETLVSHSSLWRVALDYFANCPKSGHEFLEQYVLHIPLTSDRKTKKLINIMAKQKSNRDQYGAAIINYSKINDTRNISQIANNLISAYISTGDLSYVKVIDSVIGLNSLYTSSMKFLSQYRDFHELYKSQRFVEAGKLLVSLLTTHTAPRKFWITILIDAIPLLEGDELVFDTFETYELMRCAEEIATSPRKRDYFMCLINAGQPSKTVPNDVIESSIAEMEQQMQVLNMACVRNLARATIVQY